MSSRSLERPEPALTSEHKRILFDIAAASIEHGFEYRQPLPVDPLNFPEPLQGWRSSFVTLRLRGALRGCLGSLEAKQPLVSDVANNAYKAAFADPRFPPLSREEFQQVDMSVSILTAPEPLSFKSEADLIRQLRPGLDGLILEEGSRRGTFLPSLWETLRDPHEFLRQLKQKAGLPADYWSGTLKVQRYTTETIEKEAPIADAL